MVSRCGIRAGGPGLRAAGDGVGDGALAGRAPVPPEQLGQPVVGELRGCVEQRAEEAAEVVVEAVLAQAAGEQRVVVRPHRAGVVAERVVARVAGGKRAHPPAREQRIAHQRVAHRAGAFGRDRSGPEQMAGVRREPRAGTLGAVETDGVGADLGQPEALQRQLDPVGPVAQPLRFRRVAVELEQLRHAAQRADRVALDLHERHGRLERSARAVRHPVPGVLPALVGEAVLRAAAVLDQPVAVEVAVPVDPVERSVDLGTQLAEQVEAAGPVGVVAQQRQPQRRGVGGAVVAREGCLAERGRLAHAQLVEHLAGLLVAGVVVLAPEQAAQQPERVRGSVGLEGQHLHGADQAVAAEQRRVPGHSGGVVGVATERRAQQPEVLQRAREHAVEQLVAGGDLRPLGDAPQGDDAGARCVPLGRAEAERQLVRGARGKVDLEARGRGRVGPEVDPLGLLAELDRGLAHNAVPPARPERQAGAVGLDPRRRPTAARHEAADREHGLEVGGQPQVQLQPDLLAAMVAHDQPLRQGAGGGDYALPAHGERPLVIGQLVQRHRAERVRGLEEHRGLAVDQQLVDGQEAAVAVPEAERVRPVRGHVAVARDHQKDVVLLDDERLGQIQVHA